MISLMHSWQIIVSLNWVKDFMNVPYVVITNSDLIWCAKIIFALYRMCISCMLKRRQYLNKKLLTSLSLLTAREWVCTWILVQVLGTPRDWTFVPISPRQFKLTNDISSENFKHRQKCHWSNLNGLGKLATDVQPLGVPRILTIFHI